MTRKSFFAPGRSASSERRVGNTGSSVVDMYRAVYPEVVPVEIS